jgi:hypothetical protein
LTAA